MSQMFSENSGNFGVWINVCLFLLIDLKEEVDDY